MKAHKFKVRRWRWRIRGVGEKRGPEGSIEMWRGGSECRSGVEWRKIIDVAIAKANRGRVKGLWYREIQLRGMKKMWG